MNPELVQKIKHSTNAEVHIDPLHRRAYSVDASIFEIEPLGVVIPKTKEDVIQLLKLLQEYKVPAIPRGAATGITGGCIGQGMIIDTSKYLNCIREVNYEEGYAIVEPGVVQDRLNELLAPKGYRLGPDTSTGNRATIGGMMANNAAGARSLRYGKMSDHVLEVELILMGGECIRFSEITQKNFEEKCLLNTREGAIYRTLQQIRSHDREEIEKNFPKIPRRASGYNLDSLIGSDNLSVAKLITGSEGTLGIATEIKVRICKKPDKLGVCVVHFSTLQQGFSSVVEMLKFQPLAIEMIDQTIISTAKNLPSMEKKLDWVNGTPKMVLIVEFDASTLEVLSNKLQEFMATMQDGNIGYAHTILTDPKAIQSIWEVRKSGLGLLLSKRTYSRAIAFVEDLSIAPEHLATFMDKFLVILKNAKKEAGIYGHVGSGCMHIRPYIDLRSKEELKVMQQIMRDVANLTLEYHGALSGEHGDGIIRAWLNETMFGPQIYQAFISLKAAFDPDHLMNPGKIIAQFNLEKHLRISPETKFATIPTFLNFSKEGGFNLAVDLCNGNAMCRKKENTMCPPFQVSGDEYHTTRARAQALRAITNGKAPVETLTSERLMDVMDLCIECKGCKSECPSQVDMAKLKAEVLFQYQEKNGYSFRSKLFGHIALINRLAYPFASLFNWVNKTALMKSILQKLFGITAKRSIPKIAKRKFSACYAEYEQPQLKEKIILFNDTYTEFNAPEIGLAAIKVLNAMGYEVIVPPFKCCGRPLISKGLLKEAKQYANEVLTTLSSFAKEGTPIIGLEPSCILTIKDDFESLLDHKALPLSKVCLTFDEFVHQKLYAENAPLILQTLNKTILLHGHCHQKSLVGTVPTLSILKSIPGAQVHEIPSGCCGMAGSFGYEKEHYEMSMKIGNLKLFPAIENAESEAVIVANGISCRTQIADGTNRRALHLAELLASLLADIH